MLELTADAPTSVGKHVTSNIACERIRYSLLIGPNNMCVMTLSNFPHYLEANVSQGMTNKWIVDKSIGQIL